MQRIITSLSILALLVTFLGGFAEAAGTNIEGVVKDAETGDPLFGANIIIVGTSMGAATDMSGKYVIMNVNPGTYTLHVSYIGYIDQKVEITVKANKVEKHDFKLKPVGIEGQTVIVTAQASGQTAAINQQLSSNNIVNVVSAAKIQELPDANAAESVGRLPGVSLVRSGGEGYEVAIRGLAPQYNEVEINGVQFASSDPNDRSVDLSMISSDMLQGIKLSKTVTPDMDANTLGGVVNFDMLEAKVDNPGVPKISLLLQGSYNGLSDVLNKYNNYKYVLGFSDRILNDKFGIFAQVAFERKNLSDNELGATYGNIGNSLTAYTTNTVTLDDVYRDRQRKNGVINLDYTLPKGKISLFNFFSTGVTETLDRQQSYSVANNTQNFIFNYADGTLNSITNMLILDQELPVFHMKVTLSHSYSETKDPNDWTFNFQNGNAGIKQFYQLNQITPTEVVGAANNQLSNTNLFTVASSNSFTRERDLAAALDFDTHLNLSDFISAVVKFGGKYLHQTRSYDYNIIDGEPFGYSSSSSIVNGLKAEFPWIDTPDGKNILMAPFVQSNDIYGKFLDGDYSMIYPLNYSFLQATVNYMNANQIPNNITYNYDIGNSEKNDYNGTEDVSAAYLMATIDVGQMLTIIPGVRFQQLKTEYTARQGLQGPNPYSNYASQFVTYTAYHPYWLPDVLVIYKPMSWLNVHLGYTNTVSYPSYNELAPIITVSQTSGTLQWNGFQLSPIRSVNYDASVSIFNNTLGLFTAGGFLKQITNLIYPYTITPQTAQDLVKYYPAWVPNKTPLTGIQVSEYINNPYKINNTGMELEWQTHFWYLPGVLSGLVLDVNYTHIFSKAQYPQQYIINGRPPKIIDSSYYAPLLFQPDNIFNLALGYDYKGFSIRISSIYSSKIFTGAILYPQLRASTLGNTRWDIALKQSLPFKNLDVFLNLNNINSSKDISAIAASNSVPTSQQNYGYTIDLGLRYEF